MECNCGCPRPALPKPGNGKQGRDCRWQSTTTRIGIMAGASLVGRHKMGGFSSFLPAPTPLTPRASINYTRPAWERVGELNLTPDCRATRTRRLGRSVSLPACSKPSKSRGTQSSKLEFSWFAKFSTIRARFSKVGRDPIPTIALFTLVIRNMITVVQR